MKVLILIILISFCISAKGQELYKSKIVIQAISSVSGAEFFVSILKSSNKIKIVYKIKDSISSKADSDMNLAKYRKIILQVSDLSSNHDTVLTYLKKIDSVNHLYTFYSLDSLEFGKKEKKEYNKLLNEVFNSSTEALENAIGNKHRVVLDGISVSFNLSKNGAGRMIYTHSPNLTSHPLLICLLKQTMDLYRGIKKNDFLNYKKTNGY